MPKIAANENTGRWVASAPAELVWLSWSDQHVVFHRPSCKTHLLNEAGHRLLTKVLIEPRSLAEIRAAVGDGDAVDTKELAVLLARFEEIGLIERKP